MIKSFSRRKNNPSTIVRDRILAGLVVFAGIVCLIRLFQLQVLNASFYKALASGQRDVFSKLIPERGDILVRDLDGKEYAVATNRDMWMVYADNRKVTDPAGAAKALAPLIIPAIDTKDKTPEAVVAEEKSAVAAEEAELAKRLSVANDAYDPLAHELDDGVENQIKALNIPGVELAPEKVRYYPDTEFGGQVLGFLGYDGNEKVGHYGVEGFWEKQLAGIQGYLKSESDPLGRIISVADTSFREKQDGSNLVLTINRTIQDASCGWLDDWVHQHGATDGSLVMLDPKTGAVMAMCGSPNFDPNNYEKVGSPGEYNNAAIWDAYEPGSVMKAITLSAALDQGKITPGTTYTDFGQLTINGNVIKNANPKPQGVQTMIQVLDQSLNTGAIFAMRQIGGAMLKNYLYAFGFGKKTGIEMDTESAGNISSVDKNREIFAATAAFGQGITATVLQLASAYGAMANGGKLMKPYIVDEVRLPDGTVAKTAPKLVGQAISEHTADLITGMLVSVVKNGEGKRAGVPGYLIAGKTGTAQIPLPNGLGYETKDTIGTFAGFAPVSDPKFVLVVRIDRPQDVQFAESSAAPLFGKIAAYTLQYLGVPPDDVK
jgi:cell division protein FtsI/penicillin-binding protein 2